MAALSDRLAGGGGSADDREAVGSFPGVEHRIEFVRSLDGVDYFNDSKATNVDATLKAIEAFDGPLWIILGGKDKGSDYTPLRDRFEPVDQRRAADWSRTSVSLCRCALDCARPWRRRPADRLRHSGGGGALCSRRTQEKAIRFCCLRRAPVSTSSKTMKNAEKYLNN